MGSVPSRSRKIIEPTGTASAGMSKGNVIVISSLSDLRRKSISLMNVLMDDRSGRRIRIASLRRTRSELGIRQSPSGSRTTTVPRPCMPNVSTVLQSNRGIGRGVLRLGERRAHAPLVARAKVTHGFWVVVIRNHLNRTATSGCVARLVERVRCAQALRGGRGRGTFGRGLHGAGGLWWSGGPMKKTEQHSLRRRRPRFLR
jgi:hypothetical protein